MKTRLAGAILLAILLRAPALAGAAGDCADDGIGFVQTRQFCLRLHTLQNPPGPHRGLIVFVHGNGSSGGPVDSYDGLLAEFGRSVPDGVVVSLLRPGYYGRDGVASSGSDAGRADNFTADVEAALAEAFARLKRDHSAPKLLVIGHSGGAALTGALIGRHPGIVDAALLMGCPCDVARWRTGRKAQFPNSLSPSDFAGQVPVSTRVLAMTGSEDDTTPPRLAEDYVARLTARGVPAEFRVMPGAPAPGPPAALERVHRPGHARAAEGMTAGDQMVPLPRKGGRGTTRRRAD